MNRAERRRRNRRNKGNTSPRDIPSQTPQPAEPQPEYAWKQIFDAKPMADGMPPSFLLYLLNEKEVFARHGKLLTAALWLQSQMVALICLQDSPELRNLAKIDNGRHLPSELSRATIAKLEELSSESLRTEFLKRFESTMPEELRSDLEKVTLDRDALAHGYVSLFRQIAGNDNIAWSPRPSNKRNEVLDRVIGPRPENTFFAFSLSDSAFEEEIARICRMMDFIALTIKQWDIPYAVFA